MSRGWNLALWTISGLLAALFSVMGGAKMVGWFDGQFVRWGYSPGFAVLIGIFEVVFAIALLLERTAAGAAFGLMAILLGAIGTHLTHGEYLHLVGPVVVFSLLGVVAWGRGPDRDRADPRASDRRSSSPQRLAVRRLRD